MTDYTDPLKWRNIRGYLDYETDRSVVLVTDGREFIVAARSDSVRPVVAYQGDNRSIAVREFSRCVRVLLDTPERITR